MMKQTLLLIISIFLNSFVVFAETEPNNSIIEANPISFGIPMPGNISGQYDNDFFKITITAKGILGISVDGFGTNIKIAVGIYDSTGTLIYNNPCSGIGEYIENYQSIICTPGVYYINIENGNFPFVGPDSYNLLVNYINDDTECNNEPNEAFNINIGDTINAYISNTDNDYYKFEITKPTVLEISIKELENFKASKGVKLFSPDGVEKWSALFGENGLSAYNDYSLCEPGTYILLVNDGYDSGCLSNKAFFPYSIVVNTDYSDIHECNNDIYSLTPITIGEVTTANFSYLNDVDYYVFPATINDSIVININSQVDKAIRVKMRSSTVNQILLNKIFNPGLGSFIISYKPVFKAENYILYFETVASSDYDKSPYEFVVNTIQNTTSISELNHQAIEVYPNPAKDLINLTGSSEFLNSPLIEITNILGKVVSKITPKDPKEAVDISHLTPGSYFITLISDGIRISKTFIKY